MRGSTRACEGGQPQEGAHGEVPAREHQGEDPVQTEDVWMYFMRPDTFPHDLMLLVNTAKAVLEQDWGALEAHLDLLLHTNEYARSRDDTRSATYQQPEADVLELGSGLPVSRLGSGVVAAARISPMDQLQALLKFIEAGNPFV
jgi:hypothetical protein